MTTSRKSVTPRRRAPAKPAAPKARKKPRSAPVKARTAKTAARAAAHAPAPPETDAIPVSVPEPVFAARVPGVEPERPVPTGRRAIFFDVENTSRAEHIGRIIDHLAVDRGTRRTDFVAVGNWRVIGHDSARVLARHGAQLVHSAPSVGVRDWSDLRIAVAAGVWLAGARPGDVLEIVSDDRAFDAVGDVASTLGIVFHRLSSRELGRQAAHQREQEAQARETADDRGRRRRYRHSRRGRLELVAGHRGEARAPERHAERAAPSATPAVAHTAPHQELIEVVRELVEASGSRSTTLDALANALKSRGFSRPPGSPRLITRLRRIREIAVSRSGTITLVNALAPPPAGDDVEHVAAEVLVAGPETGEEVEARPEEPGESPEREPTEPEVPESSEPGEPTAATGAEEPRRRRRRRGGRRWRARRARHTAGESVAAAAPADV